jgi:NAD(P)-dependent dehydrogenase (short-subunit alcohol dehydrogenase family)
LTRAPIGESLPRMPNDKDAKVAVVLGVGPGLGASVARRFAREGYAVALMARRIDSLRETHEKISGAGGRALSLPTDAADAASVAAAFAEVREQLGDPEVFVYNAGAFQLGSVSDLDPGDFEAAWKANCFGAFLAAREVIPAMVARGRGTILLTGATASLRGSANFSALAVGKFGLRALSQSLARELGQKGIHVAHVIIDGQIDTPGFRKRAPGRPTHTLLDPDGIAKVYWELHSQGPTTWTQELDLRPAVEKW